ncbi:hypothetical protein U6B65_10480 [Oscillospiraceae bacterium MB08-C2-2]|nr:hypothetical protein U6B65_10480 [Oscillospiraceae bacterium MB08-C2-2]
MIKGVNKNIIEVLETDNPCFERAILFIRENLGKKEPAQLKEEAQAYLSGLKPRRKGYTKVRLGIAAIKLGSAAAVGAAITAALLKL